MQLKIFNPSGEPVTVTRDFTYTGGAMSEKRVTTTIMSARKLDLPIGSYLEFRGERYTLRDESSIKRTAGTNMRGDAFSTTLVFTSGQYEISNCDFLDYVLGDDMYYTCMDSFSFYGDVYDLGRRIQANLDAEYGIDRWKVLMPYSGSETPKPIREIGWTERSLDSETKQISPSNENCWNALTRANSDFGFFFYLDTAKKEIYIGVPYPEFKVNDQLVEFAYGKGNGLYEIQRNIEANTVITRLRVKGSDRNIPRDYLRTDAFPRFTQNLQLPVFRETLDNPRPTDYILADQTLIDYFGIRPGTKVFDDIYPSIEGMVDTNGNAIDTIHAIEELDDTIKPDGTLVQSYFYVYLYDLGFDINDYLTSEDPTLSMKTGYCVTDFKIVEAIAIKDGEPYYSEGCRWRFRLEKDVTSAANYVLPSGNVKPKYGDKFVLLYILMPDNYILQAEQRLLEAAQAYLAENSKSKISYTINLDEIFFANRPLVANALKEGVSLRIKDNELGDMEYPDGTRYTVKSVQSLVIAYNEERQLPSYQITLTDKIASNPINRIQSEVDENKENIINESTQNTVNRRNGIRNSRNLRDLKNTIFDTDGYFNDEHLRPLSIETPYLAVGAKSRDFTVNGINIKTYKSGDTFRVSLSTGYINHRAYWWGGGDEPSEGSDKYTWGINDSLDMELPDNDKMYYIYIKAERSSQLAEWYISEEQLMFDFDINYYHFLLGVIFPVSEDRRDTSFKYGMSYISGGAIYGDVIKSINYVDDESNEGSMYGLNDGTLRIGNSDSGMDYGVTEKNTLSIFGKLNAVLAQLGGFLVDNEKFQSLMKDADGNPNILLNGTDGSGHVAAGNAAWDATGNLLISGKFESNNDQGDKIIIDPHARNLTFVGADTGIDVTIGKNTTFASPTVAYDSVVISNGSGVRSELLAGSLNVYVEGNKTFGTLSGSGVGFHYNRQETDETAFDASVATINGENILLVILKNCPKSPDGLPVGALWNNNGTIGIVE
ncbi:hypothetical protein [Dysgonomonas macrotermitis]|uniref:Uncharacterized protein n=1 Tax=Dysgonomonas macrotermitis TaxID=1346286 RepID=A0A1M5GLJ7_9BACT|nr:hypothetical protein [Dysgonomonas macrotermitis]SHG04589.1 hypothetical protein SAMN05444362_11456 [Dysgonomonas macrotermitis]